MNNETLIFTTRQAQLSSSSSFWTRKPHKSLINLRTRQKGLLLKLFGRRRKSCQNKLEQTWPLDLSGGEHLMCRYGQSVRLWDWLRAWLLIQLRWIWLINRHHPASVMLEIGTHRWIFSNAREYELTCWHGPWGLSLYFFFNLRLCLEILSVMDRSHVRDVPSASFG